MALLLALAHMGIAAVKCAAMLFALTLVAAGPAPRHACHHRRPPVILPELASADLG